MGSLDNSADENPAQVLPQVIGHLEAWGIEPCQAELVSQSENIVYKVTAQDGVSFALRVHRPGYHTLPELNSEHEWTKALATAGFNVPTARPTVAGENYVAVQVGNGVRYLGLVEWLDGASLYDLTRDNQNSELLGSTLGRLGETMALLHLHAENWQPSSSFVRHHLNVEGFFGRQPHWGRYWEVELMMTEQREILDRTRPQIIEQLARLGQDRRVYGMAHTDLHHGNVFLSDNEIYLIDFDDAGFSWYLYDIAVALQEYQQREDFQTLLATLVAGYRRKRKLSAEEVALIPLFLHIRSRATIGWASARPELDNAERIKTLIERTCLEAEALLS